VILYCAFGEEECAGDFAIAGALRNEAKYLDFTFGQRLDYGLAVATVFLLRRANSATTFAATEG
jgi:hypothetical protein